MIYVYILLGIFIFFLAVYLYKRRLTDWRDNADFTTVQGQALIKACNRKLDFINGYRIFNRRTKRGHSS